MDKLLYTAMTGARYLMSRQDTAAQNMAHASTPGYRAQIDALRSSPLPGADARVFAMNTTVGADFSPGPVQHTGRDLDVAFAGRGWFAVLAPDGNEAYTRFGSFEVTAEGLLQTRTGLAVLDQGGGPIAIPPNSTVSVGADGTISATANTGARVTTPVARIKLASAEDTNMVRGADGLFRTRDGEPAAADPALRVASQSLEGSNVNAVEAMVTMIAVARQFELQMKMISSAEENARQADRLLAHNG